MEEGIEKEKKEKEGGRRDASSSAVLVAYSDHGLSLLRPSLDRLQGARDIGQG